MLLKVENHQVKRGLLKNIIRYDSKISYLAYRTEINSPIVIGLREH